MATREPDPGLQAGLRVAQVVRAGGQVVSRLLLPVEDHHSPFYQPPAPDDQKATPTP
jgi:hypothetical protein